MVVASIRAADDWLWLPRYELRMVIAGVRLDYDKIGKIFVAVDSRQRSCRREVESISRCVQNGRSGQLHRKAKDESGQLNQPSHFPCRFAVEKRVPLG